MKINFIGIMALSFYSLFPIEAHEKLVKLRADEWCPYNCVPGSKKPGFMVEIAQRSFQISAKNDYKIDYQTLNWARSLEFVKSGKIEGVIGAIESEAKGLTIPKISLGQFKPVFIVNSKTKWRFTNMADLGKNKLMLGLIKDYDYDDRIVSFIKKFPKRVEFTHGDTPLRQLINMLNHNRVQIIVEDEAVFNHMVNQLGEDSKKFTVAGQVSIPKPLFIAFTAKNKSESALFANILTNGMKKLRETGEMNKILGKYGLKDWN
ncbi:MAG: substrate-binding periplasmic protein [Oligoflexales bacterium]